MEVLNQNKPSDLPESSDEFWQEADKHSKKVEHTLCDHSFVHKSATNVECEKCHIGFVLAKDWNIKNKKLYYNDTFVV